MRVLVPLPIDLSVMANGRTLRIVNLLRELNHICELRCLVPNDHRRGAARKALPDVCIESSGTGERSTNVLKRWPAGIGPVGRWAQRAFNYMGIDEHTLKQTCHHANEVDAVLGFDLDSLVYLLGVMRTRHSKSPRVVYDAIDDPLVICKSMPMTRRLSIQGIKQRMVVHLLRRQLRHVCDALTAVSLQDADSLSNVSGMDVQVVPNGVWLTDEDVVDVSREPMVVFTGAMQFPPNASAAGWLIKRVWPRVLRLMRERADSDTCMPPTQLAIVGTSPSPELCRLGQKHGVLVTGRVDDLSAWLRRARVAVAPMISGSGIKNKVLEASANGCPVVSTSLGVTGLPVGEQNGLLVADDPEQFAEKVVLLLENPSSARVLGMAGHAMVSRQYAWPRIARQLIGIMRDRNPARSQGSDHDDDASRFWDNEHNHAEPSNCKEALTHATS